MSDGCVRGLDGRAPSCEATLNALRVSSFARVMDLVGYGIVDGSFSVHQDGFWRTSCVVGVIGDWHPVRLRFA